MPNSVLHTKRLTLRVVTPEVYSRVFSLGENETMDFFGFSTVDELEKEKARFENGLQTFNKTFLYFQLIATEAQTIIGWCGYHTWYTDHDRAEIGYGLISDEFKRQGYMTEALKAMIDYGFNEMNLHRIEAFASPDNVASIKLLDSKNFEKEGLLKEHYLKDGVYEDSAV
ncbi:MAG: GNAT family protein [Crocinitomicaceae bacterium]|nr:GNAT family protein [Crocinitomicaceae bacterium]